MRELRFRVTLVWLWFRSAHCELAAGMMRTSEPPHWRFRKTVAAARPQPAARCHYLAIFVTARNVRANYPQSRRILSFLLLKLRTGNVGGSYSMLGSTRSGGL